MIAATAIASRAFRVIVSILNDRSWTSALGARFTF
jgi:hypothetical protein